MKSFIFIPDIFVFKKHTWGQNYGVVGINKVCLLLIPSEFTVTWTLCLQLAQLKVLFGSQKVIKTFIKQTYLGHSWMIELTHIWIKYPV